MNTKNKKRKHLAELRNMEVRICDINSEDFGLMIWCSSCHHVNSLEAWINSDFSCPSEKCSCNTGVLWENYQRLNPKHPQNPIEGKYYAP